MAKVTVEAHYKEVAKFDAGDLPAGLVKAVVKALVDGTMTDGWSLADLGAELELDDYTIKVGE